VANVQKVWAAAKTAAGLPDHIVHSLRHSFASALSNSRIPLFEIGRVLGHAQLATTTRYAHHAPRAAGRHRRHRGPLSSPFLCGCQRNEGVMWRAMCMNVKSPPVFVAAIALLPSSDERGTPPLRVQSTPVSAHNMHFRRWRRSVPSPASVIRE
jgi:hypothetical protein